MSGTKARLVGAMVALSQTFLPVSPARADAALAQALFDEGKRLMDAGQPGQACPKFAASYAEEAKTGTQFQLANCLEAAGKTASAWATFLEVAGKSKARGEADRERVARDRAKAVEGKLTKLRVVVTDAEQTTGLELLRDGKSLDPASWGIAVAVDPGSIVVEARAPGRLSWKSVVDARGEGATVTVAVPKLGLDESPGQQAPPDASPKAAERGGVPAWGIVGGVVAGLALGATIGVGVEHANAVSDLSSRCPDGTCVGLGPDETAALRSRWDSSLIGTIALGGVAVAGTVVLIAGAVTGTEPSKKGVSARARPPRIGVRPNLMVGTQGFVGGLDWRF